MTGSSFIAFFGMFMLDFVWAKYTQAITAKRATKSGLYAGAIVLFNGAVVLNYVENHWMLIPTVAGAFAGTWAAVITNHKGKIDA